MPTSFQDIFYVMDPANPPPDGTFLTTVTLTVTDRNDNGLISRSGGDRIQNIDIRQVYPGDTVTIETADGTQITYVGVTFYLANGQEVFSPIDGQTLVNGTLVDTTFVLTETDVTPAQMEVVPCFTPGTLIETRWGARAVETLRVGDLIATQDTGMQPLRWIGRRTVTARGKLAPIRIRAGALGNERDLLVSPQHRMLLTGWQAELLFGEEEVLVAAKHLVNGDTIHSTPRRSVDYIHLLFDRHEIIFAEGIATESFHPGDFVMETDPDVRAEILSIFPELDQSETCDWPTARKVAKAHEAALIRSTAA
ncbi:MAG: Hint domain-containing protein [Aestuariivita sp.]|uniref:Hint domain-containing protein n=1 Tax=Aestuariivita sp. TaxID=1872407 RepID=UPI003BB0DE01